MTKRYSLSREYANNIGVPGMAEHPQGEYVKYSDYAAAIAHNEVLILRLKKADAELETIGAGGVSGQRITGRAALQSQDAKDALRYRALVASGHFVPAPSPYFSIWGLRTTGGKASKAELDEAIDHARSIEGE